MAHRLGLRRDTRRLFQTFRGPLLTALPLGFVLGAAAGLILWLNELETGNGPSLAYLAGVGGALGAGLSAIAALGAIAALITTTRHTADATEERLLLRVGLGAAAAVASSVLILGAGSAIVTDSWEWYGITCWVATITAIVSGVSATATTALFRYRPRGRP